MVRFNCPVALNCTKNEEEDNELEVVILFQDLNKDVVVILNKIDLVPPEVSIAWKHYLHNKFPQLHIVLYTNDPQNFVPYLADSQGDNCSVAEKGKRMDISVFGKIKTARRKPTAKCNYAPPIGLQVTRCSTVTRYSTPHTLSNSPFN